MMENFYTNRIIINEHKTKKWLPQLKDIENKHLHYWEEYYKEYDLSKINYYKPIVNYAESKKKGIQMYKRYL
jgi:deoxyribodipyrimidine photolyase